GRGISYDTDLREIRAWISQQLLSQQFPSLGGDIRHSKTLGVAQRLRDGEIPLVGPGKFQVRISGEHASYRTYVAVKRQRRCIRRAGGKSRISGHILKLQRWEIGNSIPEYSHPEIVEDAPATSQNSLASGPIEKLIRCADSWRYVVIGGLV